MKGKNKGIDTCFLRALCTKFSLNATYRRKQIKSDSSSECTKKKEERKKKKKKAWTDFIGFLLSAVVIKATSCLKSLSLHCHLSCLDRHPTRKNTKTEKKIKKTCKRNTVFKKKKTDYLTVARNLLIVSLVLNNNCWKATYNSFPGNDY